MTEKEKMLAGEYYSAIDPELLRELNETKDIIQQYNNLRPSDTQGRFEILKNLIGKMADDNALIIQPDEAYVTIGDDCFIGPNVSIYTACHSTNPIERNSRKEWALPVTIGNNVWIGGSVTILPGVTIGDNVTIGAGSVVVKDIPSNVIAVGNPCRVIKRL